MGVIDRVKEVADLVKKTGDIDLYRKIVHAEGEVIDLSYQLRSAEERIKELESALKFAGALTFKAPFYFAEGDAVPYCQRCWEVDKCAVHMTNTNTNGSGAFYHCSQCKTTSTDKTKATRPTSIGS